MLAKNTDEGLKRVIGVPGLASTIINNTIGVGIFVLPAIVCIEIGAAGVLSYLFCSIMMVTIMLCYVEIGSRVNASGGSYIYVETAFGPLAGFITNCLYFFGWGILGSAAVMNVVADSVAVFFPIFSNPLIRALLYGILLGALIWINIRGTKNSLRFLQYLTVTKLIPLVAIIIFGLGYVKQSNLHIQHLPSIKTFGSTALILFFAFVGFETSLGVSGEIKNPKHTIPRGILLGAAIVFVFYILIQIVVQGVLGTQINQFKDAPLAAVAGNIIGSIGATILLAAAIVSAYGNVSGDVMATPRLLFAGAKDGLFPKSLAKVHPKFATPYIAVTTYALLIFIFSVSGEFKQLAVLASGALLLVYLGVVLSMFRLRRRKEPVTEEAFKVPGGLIIPLIAIAAIIWLLVNLSTKEMISTAIFLAAVAVIYVVMNAVQKKPSQIDNPPSELARSESSRQQ